VDSWMTLLDHQTQLVW